MTPESTEETLANFAAEHIDAAEAQRNALEIKHQEIIRRLKILLGRLEDNHIQIAENADKNMPTAKHSLAETKTEAASLLTSLQNGWRESGIAEMTESLGTIERRIESLEALLPENPERN